MKTSIKAIIMGIAILSAGPAQAADIDVQSLVQTIIMAESSGRPHVVGDGGKARGLMQIQRATWERYSNVSWDKAFDPRINRMVGEAIVHDIMRRQGERATAASVIYEYNTGKRPGAVLPTWTRRHPNLIYRSVFTTGRYQS